MLCCVINSDTAELTALVLHVTPKRSVQKALRYATSLSIPTLHVRLTEGC